MDQGCLFESNKKIKKSENKSKLEREIMDSEYGKDYFMKIIKDEEFLWDMRCWEKPKNEYNVAGVIKHIDKWIAGEKRGIRSHNCGHCIWCIEKLLKYRWATKREIAKVVLKNNKITHMDEIGQWGDVIKKNNKVQLHHANKKGGEKNEKQ